MWNPGLTLEDVEKICILEAYQFFHKNKTRTAQGLGIAIRTLDAKLARYNGEPEPMGLEIHEDKPKPKVTAAEMPKPKIGGSPKALQHGKD